MPSAAFLEAMGLWWTVDGMDVEVDVWDARFWRRLVESVDDERTDEERLVEMFEEVLGVRVEAGRALEAWKAFAAFLRGAVGVLWDYAAALRYGVWTA